MFWSFKLGKMGPVVSLNHILAALVSIQGSGAATSWLLPSRDSCHGVVSYPAIPKALTREVESGEKKGPRWEVAAVDFQVLSL